MIYIIPLMLCIVCIVAFYEKIDVFNVFLKGCKQGLQTVISIMPTLIAMLTAIYMLRASGFLDAFAYMIEPVLEVLGIPKECSPLIILKPISGSGGLAIGSEIISSAGVDSRIGIITAIMLGASETSLYTMSIYSGKISLKKLRYAIFAAIVGDMIVFAIAPFFV